MSDFELSADEFRALYDRVKHMSRWGPADRRGALNNISPAQVVAAASDIWRGRAVSLAALELLAERRIAVLGSDDNNDTAPSAAEGVDFPVHVLAVNAMGLHLMDRLQFDDLVAVCEELNRWSFLCVVAPLRLPAATGSPVNPIVIF
jgi:kynurenine formamidase